MLRIAGIEQVMRHETCARSIARPMAGGRERQVDFVIAAATLVEVDFGPPSPLASVDVDAHARLLPAGATTKGMYFDDFLRRVSDKTSIDHVVAEAKLPQRKYTSFRDYPYADLLRLTVASSKVLYPGVPIATAVRHLGRTIYSTLLETHAGRVVFGVLGIDFGTIIRHGPKGYRLTTNFSKLEVEDHGPRHVRYRYRDMPCFIESMQVGVIEGAMAVCKTDGQVTVRMTDLANGDLDVRW